jgi:hypothetical protein
VNGNAPVDIDRITLELIVPKQLLTVAFHEWIYDRGRLERPLGIRYPLVLRVLERQAASAYHDEWRVKTRRLADYGRALEPRAVHCVLDDPEDVKPARLYAQLSEEQITCAAIPFPPEVDTNIDAGLFGAALDSGVPIIAWSEDPVDPAQFCDLVRGKLAADGLLSLPARVLSYRRAALNTDSGRPRVSVVFDRFDHLPDQFRRPLRFSAPR